MFEIPNRIRIDVETVKLPDGRLVSDYVQVHMNSFVVVFAETTEAKVICIRQYKHGPQRVSLTLPAGQLEQGEDGVAAARRELMEETGFEGRDFRLLGSFAVSGNQGCGTGQVALAKKCRQVAVPMPDDLEQMKMEFLSREQLREALLGGQVAIVSHAAAIGIGLLVAG